MALVLALQATQGLQIPAPSGYVNDFANVLRPADEAALERLVGDVRAKSRGDIAVVTLPDLGGRSREEVALRIGREWKVGAMAPIGEAERNAGVVILLVPKETNSSGRGDCRVETGQGAEGFITDFQAAELCRAAIPYFEQRDYSTGTRLITAGVAQRFAQEFGFTLDTAGAAFEVPRGQTRLPRSGGFGFSPILVFLVVLFLMSAFGGRRRRGRGGCGGGGCIPLPIFFPMGGGGYRGGGWGGGGFGGGFGGFGGGGGFSGGGGGSSW